MASEPIRDPAEHWRIMFASYSPAGTVANWIDGEGTLASDHRDRFQPAGRTTGTPTHASREHVQRAIAAAESALRPKLALVEGSMEYGGPNS